MEEGVHFGRIPGCGDKPTLLKAGAEKICLMFRLRSRFQIIQKDLENGHREYEIICSLYDANNQLVGEGLGLCSTKESKFRYRDSDGVNTNRPVPKEFWKTKDLSLLGGKDFKPKKTNAGWFIFEKGARVENPDIADTYNTVLKVSKKRAYTDATITCTAASDIFTQDMDDEIKPTETIEVVEAREVAPQVIAKPPQVVTPAQVSTPSTFKDWRQEYTYSYKIPFEDKEKQSRVKKAGGRFSYKKDGGDNMWYCNTAFEDMADELARINSNTVPPGPNDFSGMEDIPLSVYDNQSSPGVD
jgi:hypothetical protein